MIKVAGNWDDVFGSADPIVSATASSLKALIYECHPQTVECVYLGYKSVNFGFGNKMNSEAYLYLMVQKDRVNLGFFHGASLSDPSGLLEGGGKALRHVKVKNVAMTSDPNICALVKDAIEERRRALALSKAF